MTPYFKVLATFVAGVILFAAADARSAVATWFVVNHGSHLGGTSLPNINDAGQVVYLGAPGFAVGVPGTPVQRNLAPFLVGAGISGDPGFCVVGENGRVGYEVADALVDDAPGAASIIAQEGHQVPGLAAGVIFPLETFGGEQQQFAMTPDGTFIVSGLLQGTGVTSSGKPNDQVLLRGPGNNLQPLIRAADPAPGLPAGYVFAGRYERRFSAVINHSGLAAIRSKADLYVDPFPTPRQVLQGIWLHDPVNGLRLVVKAVSAGVNPLGDDAPGIDTTRFRDITLGPSINDDGAIAFEATTFNYSSFAAGSGIWAGPPTNMMPVHIFGAPVPGMPGVIFDNPFDNTTVKLGRGRTVCFKSIIAGTGITAANNIGLFIGTNFNTVRLLAQLGTQAPGLPAGVNFSTLPGPGIVIFGDNRVALQANIAGPGVVNGVNEVGLWITDDAGNLQLVARNSFPVTTDQGEITITIGSFLQHGTGQDGLASSGNRNGQLAFFGNGFVGATYIYRLTVETPKPTLNFSFGQSGLSLSWPAGFNLQSTPTLSPPDWHDLNVSSPHTPATGTGRVFFRLSSP